MKHQPKPHRRPRLTDLIVAVVAIGLIAFGALSLMREGKGASATPSCEQAGQNHTLYLEHDSFSTPKLTIHQCDTLTVVNRDNGAYLLAFGNHEKHLDYPGFTEQTLTTGETVKITMVKSGKWRLHDHYRGDAFSEITVKPLKK